MNLRWWLAPIGIWAITVAVCAGWAPEAGASASQQLSVTQTPRPAAQPPAPAAGYVGSDTCETCHSDKADTLKAQA